MEGLVLSIEATVIEIEQFSLINKAMGSRASMEVVATDRCDNQDLFCIIPFNTERCTIITTSSSTTVVHFLLIIIYRRLPLLIIIIIMIRLSKKCRQK